MLPVLIVSADGNIDSFVDSYIKEHSIATAHVLDVMPEKGFLVEHSREVRDFVSQISSAHHSLVIMRSFDTATSNIQNSLLKTLEEGSEKVHFIIVVSDQSRLLPTILSRIGSPQQLEEKTSTRDVLSMYSCILGSMTYPQWLSATSKIAKTDALPFLDEVILHVERSLQTDSTALSKKAEALHQLLPVRKGLRDNNMYYEYALDAAGYILDDHGLL